jgi:hypothetical protein
MADLFAVIAVAAVSGCTVGVAAHLWVADPARGAAEALGREVRRHGRLTRFLRARVDPAVATGLSMRPGPRSSRSSNSPSSAGGSARSGSRSDRWRGRRTERRGHPAEQPQPGARARPGHRLVPTVPFVLIYVPLRVTRVRERRAVRRATRTSGYDAAFREFLARRAAEHLSYEGSLTRPRTTAGPAGTGEIRGPGQSRPPSGDGVPPRPWRSRRTRQWYW